MKYIRFSLIAVMAMMATLLQAQSNVLRVDTVTTPAGKTVTLPIVLENTSDITGVQFDISVPYELVANEQGTPLVTLSSARLSGYTVTTRDMGNEWKSYYPNGAGTSSKSLEYRKYRIIVYSPRNELVVDDRGILLSLQLTTPVELTNACLLPVYLSNVVLSDAQKQGVAVSSVNGAIVIEEIPRPDLMPIDVSVTPSAVNPAGRLTVSWQVKNIGLMDTDDGWNEQISLISVSGKQTKLISTVYYDQTLSAGGVVSRQTDIDLPALLGVDGACSVQVEVVPTEKTGEHSTLRDNNTAKSANNIDVGKQLFLELSKTRLNEGGNQRITAKLSRSGRWNNLRVFTITSTADSRFDIPKTVTIPKDQSGTVFYIDVKDNETVDADSIIDISITGDNYDAVAARIIIEDDEYPPLNVTASKTSLVEGNEFTLTITTPEAVSEPVTVKIVSEDNRRFQFPSQAVIPAGQSSVTVTVKCVDDELPNLEQSNKFTVSAQRFSPGEAIVLLQDNDMPVLTLTLTPDVVSEGAGPTAVSAVLTRTGKTDNRITVKLNDDSNDGIYYSNKTVVMEKGVETIFFNLGPIDNTLQEGDRTYTLRASIWVSSCSCSAAGEKAGTVTAQLKVLDNDGAALTVSSQNATVKEGDETTITVSRNTVNDVSKPLTVTLSSNYDTDLEYEKTVTIPAGQTSTDVIVKSKKNAVSGDSHTVIFTVAADGYGSGTCMLLVTDQTLPDARAINFHTEVSEAKLGSTITASVTIVNEGAYALPANTPIAFYQQGNTGAIGTSMTDREVPVGDSIVVSRSITLPLNVKEYVYYAVVNPNRGVTELVYTNNTSNEAVVKCTTSFTVQIQTDKQVYRQNEKVRISGQVTGEYSANTWIDIYLVYDGVRQTKQVATNATGNFATEWQLYEKQTGHFAVGACYVGDQTTEAMATFDVYGLKRVDDNYITCDVTCGEPYTGVVRLVNSGNLSLSGVKTEIVGAPAGCDAQFSLPATIGAGETVNMSYVLNGSQATQGNDWEMLKVRITSNEGAFLEVTLHYYARFAKGNLIVENQNLTTTMNKDNGRDYSFTILNNGKGNTGKISLSLPEWMKSLTGATMPGLNQNETASVVLRMMPTEDMQLNVPVTGMLGINCENGNGTFINFNITPVSDKTGTLVIDVCDEYTYYTDEKPHVKGAEIVLRNPGTGALVAQGTSDENGLWSMELPEGYYQVNVTANNHDAYKNNLFVDPGSTNTKVVNLSYKAISVSWSVEETEVEDEYNIVTTVKYETNVPAPVVELVEPDRLELDQLGMGESLIYYAILTNKGLITAENTNYKVPDGYDGCTWEPLVACKNLTLAPQQSYTIPVKVTRTGSASRMRKASGGDSGCSTHTETEWEWLCGADGKYDWYPHPIQVRDCPSGAGIGGWQSLGHDKLSSPTGVGGDTYTQTTQTTSVSTSVDCHPCLITVGRAVAECLIGYTSAGCIAGLVSGGYNAATGSNGWMDMVGVAIGGVGCFIKAKTAGIVTNTIGCIWSFIGIAANGCGGATKARAEGPRRDYAGRAARMPEWIESYAAQIRTMEEYVKCYTGYYKEFFGSDLWLEKASPEEMDDLFHAVLENGKAKQLIAKDMIAYKPQDISVELFNAFIERINNTSKFESTGEEAENMMHTDRLADYLKAMDNIDKYVIREGKGIYTGITDLFVKKTRDFVKRLQEESKSTCATISLQFDQTMTMSRQAFRGTLTVTNGNKEYPLTEAKLKLNVTNLETGLTATAKEFEMHTERLKMFQGDLDMESGWYLGADSTGTATILFIPSKYAAPTDPVEYSFGGTLTYIDPNSDLEVTRELYPVTLTVNPSPELDLTYFMQRDLYGDDALTEEIEPVVPGEFAVLINNKGNGDATNVRMVTKQPKIIDNEKGLYIDFEFVSSQLNGQEKAIAMGEAIPTEFGDIPAHSQAYAQWWLESSLLGHFVDYDIQATHVSSYGNENLSLLDQVTIHELIHGFTPQQSASRAFLVNDINDMEDLPDHIYFTDATQASVTVAPDAVASKQSNTEYTLTVMPLQAGWNYGSLLDPTAGRRKLLSIKRQSDGVELPVDNMWQTDRTLVDGKDWRYEKRLHFIVDVPASSLTTGEAYLLTFENRSEEPLEVKSITGMEYADDNPVRTEPVDEVKVTFNKAVKPETFTADDITLTVQGQKQDLSSVQFATQDNINFTLDFTTLNQQLSNGYYVLTVQTAGITDHEGYTGITGKKADWVLFQGGLVQFITATWPERAGTIKREVIDTPAGAPESGTVTTEQYGSTIRLTAIPAEGYEFVNWTIGSAEVSKEPVYVAKATADAYIQANFKKKQYRLEVTANGNGTIGGNGTGLYDYDTELQIIAQPDEEYMLQSWKVNGETVAETGDTLRINFNKATTVEAVFARAVFAQTLTMARGWNWVSSYLSEQQSLGDMMKYASRVLTQQGDTLSDFSILPGTGYKIEASTLFTTEMRGHLYAHTAQLIPLKKGWNWTAYPNNESKPLSVIANAEEGDFIASQNGFAEYVNGAWVGTVSELDPGAGYLYKSVAEKHLAFNYDAIGTGETTSQTNTAADLSRLYPHTMNITARIYRDELELDGQLYNIYANASDGMRGISQIVGQNHYLTVYGEQPAEITFVVEEQSTGKTFAANTVLTFNGDIVGSHKSPYIINIGTSTGIDQLSDNSRPMTVYTLSGVLVSRDATIKTLRLMPKGVYIVNGQKCFVK